MVKMLPEVEAPENLWTNHETFLTAANFLGYSDALFVTRAVSDTAVIAVKGGADEFKAKYYGELGNSIQVSHCDSTSFASARVGSSTVDITSGNSSGTFAGFASQAQATSLKKGDVITVGEHSLTLKADASVSGGGAPDSQFQLSDSQFQSPDSQLLAIT